jgi:hypothetical protein
MNHTGVKKDSATNRALALSCNCQLGVPAGSLSAYEKLHLRDLLVHLLHELDDKVHQLVLQHLFGVKVRDQE